MRYNSRAVLNRRCVRVRLCNVCIKYVRNEERRARYEVEETKRVRNNYFGLGRTMNRTKNAMFNREIYEAARFADGGERGRGERGEREGTKGV